MKTFNFSKFYDPVTSAVSASWVVVCDGPRNTLFSLVPSGLGDYVKIIHPCWLVDDEKALVEEFINGTEPVNGRAVYGVNFSRRKPGIAGIDPPKEGEWTAEMVNGFFDVVINRYGNQEVLCAFWEGFNRPEYADAVVKFEIPYQQAHWLYTTKLERCREAWLSVCDLPHYARSGLSPTAMWPTTGEWYLAVPYNLPHSYFGGDCVQEISRALEVSVPGKYLMDSC